MGITKSQRQVLYFLCSWIFLNMFMNFNYPAPMVAPLHILMPSLEVWAVLLFISLLAVYSIPFTFHIYIPLIILFIVLRVFRFGDVLMPLYFNRPFNLYVDTGYLPDLLRLLYHSLSPLMLVFWGCGLLMLLIFSIWGINASLRHIYACFSATRIRYVFWAVTAGQVLLVSSYLSSNYPTGFFPPATSITQRLLAEAKFISNIRQVKSDELSAVQMSATQVLSFEAPLKNLEISMCICFLSNRTAIHCLPILSIARDSLKLPTVSQQICEKQGFIWSPIVFVRLLLGEHPGWLLEHLRAECGQRIRFNTIFCCTVKSDHWPVILIRQDTGRYR